MSVAPGVMMLSLKAKTLIAFALFGVLLLAGCVGPNGRQSFEVYGLLVRPTSSLSEGERLEAEDVIGRIVFGQVSRRKNTMCGWTEEQIVAKFGKFRELDVKSFCQTAVDWLPQGDLSGCRILVCCFPNGGKEWVLLSCTNGAWRVACNMSAPMGTCP